MGDDLGQSFIAQQQAAKSAANQGALVAIVKVVIAYFVGNAIGKKLKSRKAKREQRGDILSEYTRIHREMFGE